MKKNLVVWKVIFRTIILRDNAIRKHFIFISVKSPIFFDGPFRDHLQQCRCRNDGFEVVLVCRKPNKRNQNRCPENLFKSHN